MEDVLDLYAEPYDPARPLVCFDETSKQLIGETRRPLPARPDKSNAMIMSISATAPVTCSCSWNQGPESVMSKSLNGGRNRTLRTV